jgi:hypothetical protein
MENLLTKDEIEKLIANTERPIQVALLLKEQLHNVVFFRYKG